MFLIDSHVLCCVSRSPDKPKKELCENISIIWSYSHNEHKNEYVSVERGQEKSGEVRAKALYFLHTAQNRDFILHVRVGAV